MQLLPNAALKFYQVVSCHRIWHKSHCTSKLPHLIIFFTKRKHQQLPSQWWVPGELTWFSVGLIMLVILKQIHPGSLKLGHVWLKLFSTVFFPQKLTFLIALSNCWAGLLVWRAGSLYRFSLMWCDPRQFNQGLKSKISTEGNNERVTFKKYFLFIDKVIFMT